MKNLRIQNKNPEIQVKNLKVWSLSCKIYSQANCQEFVQIFSKNPILKNEHDKKNLQSFVREPIRQESRNPKLLKRKIKILDLSLPIPYYLRWLFLRIVTAPPPYTMESINTLQVFMEVTNFASKNFKKQIRKK